MRLLKISVFSLFACAMDNIGTQLGLSANATDCVKKIEREFDRRRLAYLSAQFSQRNIDCQAAIKERLKDLEYSQKTH